MNCIFCDIIKGSKPGYIIYQDEKTIALLDIFPSVEGHMMIVPKRHGKTVFDFSKEELGALFETVKKVSSALKKTYNTDAFTIGINHGEMSGVPHLHVHVIPRHENDGGGIIQTIVKKKVDKKLEDIVSLIKKNI